MSLSKEEIKFNLNRFVQEWKDEKKENEGSQTFWNELFRCFGIERKKYARFEKKVKKFDGNTGRIDVFWEGVLLAEQKSKGKDLQKAMQQAKDYLPNLKNDEVPRYIIICDFNTFVYEDLETQITTEFNITDLPNKIDLFHFFTGFDKTIELNEVEVSRKATDILTKLYKTLQQDNYDDESAMTLIIRLMFCLFAEDTEIFYKKNAFYELILNHSKEDGSDLGSLISDLFDTLNTPKDKRSNNLPSHFKPFGYVNGTLFQENIKLPYFNAKLRSQIIKCCEFDWSKISPVIFGSMFQNISKDRDKNGVHYTSYINIRKVIDSLFLDDLYDEFEQIKTLKSIKELKSFHKKISQLTFLDPACGCGNFLVTIYQELRLLEIQILEEINEIKAIQLTFNVADLSSITIDNFYGIELLNFPSKVAQLSMWLIDHLMNLKLGETFGKTYRRLPLEQPLKILSANALQCNWNELIEAKDLDYIIGNPPFIGSKRMDKNQRNDIVTTFGEVKKIGNLDYVCGWYWKAAELFESNSKIKIGLVSTNSITMGEQVELLWQPFFEKFKYVEIKFAHRTFSWSNKAKDKAAVHCVIIGLGKKDKKPKYIFEYEDIKGEPVKIEAKRINPYLIDYDFVVIKNRTKPISNVPEMIFGNMPNDNKGQLLFSDKEKDDFLKIEPKAKPFIKQLISNDEYMSGEKRWCLWLVDSTAKQRREMPYVMERIKNVRDKRASSTRIATRKLADVPHLFGEIRPQNSKEIIFIPAHGSERRKYIPIGFFNNSEIPHNSGLFIPTNSMYIFGIIQSYLHMVWVYQVGGKIKNDPRYSIKMVYNNFPFPKMVTDKEKQNISDLASNILKERDKESDSSPSDLYDVLNTPIGLKKAHDNLDKAVEKLCRKKPFETDKERIEFLFQEYEKQTKNL